MAFYRKLQIILRQWEHCRPHVATSDNIARNGTILWFHTLILWVVKTNKQNYIYRRLTINITDLVLVEKVTENYILEIYNRHISLNCNKKNSGDTDII